MTRPVSSSPPLCKQWGAEGILNANIDGDRAREFFLAGKSPYYLTGPWNIPAISEGGINYAIDPLPSAGGEEARPFIGVNGFFLSSKSNNALAATNFIVNYLSTEDAQMACSRSAVVRRHSPPRTRRRPRQTPMSRHSARSARPALRCRRSPRWARCGPTGATPNSRSSRARVTRRGLEDCRDQHPGQDLAPS